jgi:fused signal recognition particle receptor
VAIISNLKHRLVKTHNALAKRLAEVMRLTGKVDKELIESIEEILIQADIGIETTQKIITQLQEEIRLRKIISTEAIFDLLQNIIRNILKTEYQESEKIDYSPEHKPFVILFVGVNGVGKTTTIAKLAKKYTQKGKKVLLVAADTFRAAAIEQLSIWAKRAEADIIKQDYGADPSSVVFSSLQHAKSHNYDVVMIDTAGRLHTRVNLMRELEKINRTIKKIIPDAPHETLLVLDATTGQNGVAQAKSFVASLPVTGVVLTKLDGTAKGGVAIGIKDSLNISIKLIGVGEKMDDLRDFDIDAFVKAIFE